MKRIEELLKNKMFEEGAMGSETVTIKTSITEAEKELLTGNEPYWWEIENDVLIASACEDDFITDKVEDTQMLYEKMNFNENLSWCAPFVNGQKYIIICNNEIIDSNGVDIKDDIDNIIDNNNLKEVGCASCLNRDTCDAMRETANSTRKHFYTVYGWAGSRYDSSLSIKDIAQIVRTYVKEKYPTCKFSVRIKRASMCQSLIVELKEFPERMYKTADELRENYYITCEYINEKTGEKESFQSFSDEIQHLFKIYRLSNIFNKDSWTQEEFLNCYTKTVFEENRTHFAALSDYFKAVIDDVNDFIQSYNYDDSDSMTDYFDVNFYGGRVSYHNCKYVKKTARIKNKKNDINPAQQEKKELEATGENFHIEESTHTKTNEKIFLVKVLKTLDRENYKLLNTFFKENGGYYSKFTHSFIFKNDPTEFLKGVRI